MVSGNGFYSGEGAGKTVEMTTKDLEYYINLVVKAVPGFERVNFNFEGGFTVGKMLSKSTTCYTETTYVGKSHSVQQQRLSYFEKVPQPPQPLAVTTPVSQQPSTVRQVTLPAKRL